MSDLEQTGLELELARVRESWGPAVRYVQVKAGRICAIQPLMFTYAILADVNAWSYELRWCYSSLPKALAALDAWDAAEGTEPQGWHRAVDGSGRRRPDGDASREYVEH